MQTYNLTQQQVQKIGQVFQKQQNHIQPDVLLKFLYQITKLLYKKHDLELEDDYDIDQLSVLIQESASPISVQSDVLTKDILAYMNAQDIYYGDLIKAAKPSPVKQKARDVSPAPVKQQQIQEKMTIDKQELLILVELLKGPKPNGLQSQPKQILDVLAKNLSQQYDIQLQKSAKKEQVITFLQINAKDINVPINIFNRDDRLLLRDLINKYNPKKPSEESNHNQEKQDHINMIAEKLKQFVQNRQTLLQQALENAKIQDIAVPKQKKSNFMLKARV